MFLLDTNVLSEIRKGARCHPSVHQWAREVLLVSIGYVSVIALGEIRKGIEIIQRRDPESASHLGRWLEELKDEYSGRTLPVSVQVAEEWGRLNAVRPMPAADSLMAATANVHRLTLVTRNTGDLAATGARLLNPFA